MNRNRNFRGNRNQQSDYSPMYSGGNGGSSMYDDFEPRNNRGSRSGNRAQPLMDLRGGMSGMDYDEDFTADTYGPVKSYGSMGSMGSIGRSNKTPEQIAFDNEFEKWEKSFADWKLNNRNHPDPSQYRVYEQKFLDVRSKLLKKRREIYGEGPGSGSGKNPFDNQLNAADAMANSILSKFGSMSGNEGRKNNNNNNNNNNNQGGNERRQSGNRGGNNSGSGNNYRGNDNKRDGNDILNNELILTALKVISGGMGGPMNNMRGPMGPMGGPMNGPMGGPMGGPMFNRGYNNGGYGGGYNGGGYNDGPYGSGYGRGYNRGGYGNDGYGGGYDMNGPRNGPRRFGNDSRMGPRKVGAIMNNAGKKVDNKKKKKKPVGEKKELKDGEFDSRTPFLERIPVMYEEARKIELPKLLSGAANRRLKILKEKEADKLNEKEKLFLEYAEFVFKKRDEYYIAHPKEEMAAKTENAAKTEDVAMEDKAEAKTADKKEDVKPDDVEMKEDELLKD